jgi:hypothetical protein
MHVRRTHQRRDDGQEYHTNSGLVGWLDRNARGYVSLELSLHSRKRLARENKNRLVTEEIKRYMA